MPKISLVVCLYKERDLLERLLQHAEGCYDDLVVVHDGVESDASPPTPLAEIHIPSHRHPELAVDFSIPDQAATASPWWKTPEGTPIPGSIHELVVNHGGRYFEGPRCWQQEPHWPFAWSVARYDWILRLDADEYPSVELKQWLSEFRKTKSLPTEIAGYSCIWPLWNGKKQIDRSWPSGRVFFFNRQYVTFIGVVELSPMPENNSYFEAVSMVLEHFPRRPSYGYSNLLLRKQAYVWRRVISMALMKSPSCVPHWGKVGNEWSGSFGAISKKPFSYFLKSLLLNHRHALREIIIRKHWRLVFSFPTSTLHHALTCLDFLFVSRKVRSDHTPANQFGPF